MVFISQVINNLRIEHIEVRTEDDQDIAPYVHEKQIEFVMCEKGAGTAMQTIKKVRWSLSPFDTHTSDSPPLTI